MKKSILFATALMLLAAFSPSDLACQYMVDDSLQIDRGVSWPRDFSETLMEFINNPLGASANKRNDALFKPDGNYPIRQPENREKKQ